MRRPLLCALLLLIATTTVLARTPPPRPRIGVVLSGGGARGLAHIGVLRVLEEKQVPVDLIVTDATGTLTDADLATSGAMDSISFLMISARFSAALT